MTVRDMAAEAPMLVFGALFEPACAAAMRRHGHANGYARTLITGLWPSLDVLPPAERAATGIRLDGEKVRLRTNERA